MKRSGIKIRLHPENPLDIPESNPFQYDTLGFRGSVERLSNLIPDIETPFTLGIYGSWGTGKTSFMKMLRVFLEKDKQFSTFWFDAWQYENEKSLLIPFISKLSKQVQPYRHKKLTNSLKKIVTSVVLAGSDTLLDAVTLGRKDLKKITDTLELYENNFVSLYDKWVDDIDKFKSEFKKLTNILRKNNKSIVIFIDDLAGC